MLASACTTSVSLREDRRVQVTAPGYREQVEEPVTVTWTVDASFAVTGIDGTSTDSQGLFGVLVDVDPQPPGEGLDYLARDDDACQRAPTCPDASWFRAHGIYATTETGLVLDRVGASATRDRRDLHEVTIILLDGQGRRIGESAWTQLFEVVAHD